MGGEQNLFLGQENPNFHYDMSQLDAVLEYDFTWKNLVIRPGFSYQNANYDVSNYSTPSNVSYFEGAKEISTLAAHIRAEYLFFNKLKLIMAFRGDKYNKPDDTYFSFQLAGSYKIDDNNLLRLVYSRANQGPFMLDTYSEMIIDPGYFRFELYGNENLKLATTDMFEFGTRNQLTENIQTSFEVFYNVTNDFSLPMVDTVQVPFPPYWSTKTTTKMQYQNLPLKTYQAGMTGSIDYVLNKNLRIKGFGTLQLTAVEDLNTKVKHDEYGYSTSYLAVIDLKHESTPAFYGGLMANYSPNSKLNIFANVYYYSKQEFRYDDAATRNVETIKIEPKLIADMKVSYKFWKNNSVYANFRNLLNDSKKEFAFGDDGAGLYLIGLNLSF
jgi:iron complex outermembrane receptor protein